MFVSVVWTFFLLLSFNPYFVLYKGIKNLRLILQNIALAFQVRVLSAAMLPSKRISPDAIALNHPLFAIASFSWRQGWAFVTFIHKMPRDTMLSPLTRCTGKPREVIHSEHSRWELWTFTSVLSWASHVCCI